MTLLVAVMSDGRVGGGRSAVPWWCVVPAVDAAGLADLEVVRAGSVTRLVVLAPSRLASRAHVLASTVASVSPQTRVHVAVRPTTSLALATVVERVAAVLAGSSEPEPGLVLDLVDRTLTSSYAGAWLKSVSGLTDPAPSVSQHFTSWLPGGRGYLVLLSPERLVTPLGQAVLPAGGQGRALAAPVSDGPLPDGVTRALSATGAQEGGRVVDAVDDPAQAWGTPRNAVSFVVLPYVLPTPASSSAVCPVCGDRVWTAMCPMCHVHAALLEGTAP